MACAGTVAICEQADQAADRSPTSAAVHHRQYGINHGLD
jgi:hypothetical protein